MAFHSINRERFFYLLDNGTQDGEVRRFFTDCRTHLLLKGARVQNLPHGRIALIRAVVERIPVGADDVVKNWFQKNITMVEPQDVATIISEFELYEVAGDTLPLDQAKQLSRSCLAHLFSDQPPSELMSFLRSTIGQVRGSPSATVEAEEAIAPLPVDDQLATDSRLSEGLIKLLAAIAEDEDVGDLLDTLPTAVGSYVAGLLYSRRGDVEAAMKAAEVLPTGSQEHQLLLRNIKRARSRDMLIGRSAGGVETAPPAISNRDVDPQLDQVLGYCTNSERPSAVFIKPIGIVRHNTVLLLTPDQQSAGFPETGSIIAFPGSSHTRQPERGEIGLWQVAEHSTDKKTRFHLESEVAQIYEVVKVPFHGSDPDSVRDFIKSVVGTRKRVPLQPQLYALSDGLTIRPRSEHADLTRDDGFEQPFRAWTQLTATLIEGRTLVIGPLPNTATAYDCAPLSTTVKQIARAAVEKKAVQLTKAQIKDLVDTFQSLDVGVGPQRLGRISAQFDRIVADEDALQDAASVLMSHPAVVEKIKLGVEQMVQRRAADRDRLTTEIAKLSGESKSWEAKIRDLQDKHRRKARDATAVVKASFDKAVASGIAALAEVEVINALSGRPPMPELGSSGIAPKTLPVSRIASSEDNAAISLLSSYEIDKRMAMGILETARIVLSSGLSVSFRGTFARFATRAIASAMGGEAVVAEVGIGLTESDAITALMLEGERAGTMVLLDANLSDLDLYARPLIDHLVDRARDPVSVKGPGVLFAWSESAMSLSIPKVLSKLSLLIDLDKKIDFGQPIKEGETFLSDDTVEISRLSSRVLDRIRDKVDSLESPLRSVVSMIIVEALTA
jgi:hypothetical protein